MKKITKTMLKKYASAIKRDKRKVVTCEMLSTIIGVYPEVIAEHLAMFDPMIRMDYSYNLKDLLSEMEKHLAVLENESNKLPKPERVSKKEIDRYGSLAMFIFEKMTTGGIVDRNASLSDHDLKLLKKLIVREEAERKKAKK